MMPRFAFLGLLVSLTLYLFAAMLWAAGARITSLAAVSGSTVSDDPTIPAPNLPCL